MRGRAVEASDGPTQLNSVVRWPRPKPPNEPRRKPCDTTAGQPRLATANGRPRSTRGRRGDDAPRGRAASRSGQRNRRGSAPSRPTPGSDERGRAHGATTARWRTNVDGWHPAMWHTEMCRQPRCVRPTPRAATPEPCARTTDERRQRTKRQSAGPPSGGAALVARGLTIPSSAASEASPLQRVVRPIFAIPPTLRER